MYYKEPEKLTPILFYNCKTALQNPFVYQQNQGFYTTYTYEENTVIYRASATQNGLYCYTYCLNNPLKYTDPSGEMVYYSYTGWERAWRYFSSITSYGFGGSSAPEVDGQFDPIFWMSRVNSFLNSVPQRVQFGYFSIGGAYYSSDINKPHEYADGSWAIINSQTNTVVTASPNYFESAYEARSKQTMEYMNGTKTAYIREKGNPVTSEQFTREPYHSNTVQHLNIEGKNSAKFYLGDWDKSVGTITDIMMTYQGSDYEGVTVWVNDEIFTTINNAGAVPRTSISLPIGSNIRLTMEGEQSNYYYYRNEFGRWGSGGGINVTPTFDFWIGVTYIPRGW